MPDTVASHEPRTAGLLDRVKGVFASKGFDGASMQDLARAAGMSAGNFYRYFPSKAAIIEAMIARDLAEVETEFAAIRQSGDPRQALLQTIAAHVRQRRGRDGPLWAEIQAAAGRKEEIAGIMGRMQREVSHHLIGIFAVIAGMPVAAAAERFGVHAQVIVMIVVGATMDACPMATEDTEEDYLALVVRTIDRILDEVAQSSLRKSA